MRRFNTSSPNILKQHYTLPRENFIQKGLELVEENRYFTIWAPRQTGKSYREANVALGRTDLLINVQNEELLIETKVLRVLLCSKKAKNSLHIIANIWDWIGVFIWFLFPNIF